METKYICLKVLIQLTSGITTGTIVEPRGSGFGWDNIFQPDSYSLTFGEMTSEQKNSCSHRMKAVELFKQHLNEQSNK